jgi:hypothetical protein
MEDNEQNTIEVMGKYIVITMMQFSPAIHIYAFTKQEHQEEMFQAIKDTGKLPERNGSIQIAKAYTATIDKRYEAKMQIIQPIFMPKN